MRLKILKRTCDKTSLLLNRVAPILILIVITFLSVGYSAFVSKLNISGTVIDIRPKKDIRITNINVEKIENGANTQYEDYNFNTITSEVILPSNDSSVTYKIDVTNFGGTYMVISKINGLPDNLEYTLDNYDLNDLICDDNNKCNLGVTQSIYLTIKQKNELKEVDNTIYGVNLEFSFKEFSYTINYLPSEKPIELVENLSYDDSDNDSIIEDDGVYTINKNGNYTGLYIPSETFEDEKTYVLLYKLQKVSGVLKNIGGHSRSVIEKSFLIDGKPSLYSYNQPGTNLYDDSKEHTIEFKFKYNSDLESSEETDMNIYIQANKMEGTAVPVIVKIYDVKLYEVVYENEYNYNEEVIIESGLEKEDYIFSGWNTNSDGSGTSYYEGEIYTNLTLKTAKDINLYSQWKNYVGEKMYNVIGEFAVMDNGPSQFVKNDTGIDFTAPSSNENGKGVYIVSNTVNNSNPIYYYRGAVENNNVILGNYCWKILRTTDTGGVKLIFSGLKSEEGTCENTGGDTQLYSSKSYNGTGIGVAGAGYSYTDKTSLKMTAKNDSTVVAGTIFSNNITYDENTKKYILTGDKITTTTDFTSEKNDKLNEHHYTCFKTVDEQCDLVYYVYMGRDAQIFYATLRNGNNIEDLLNIEFEGNSTNENKSSIHTTIENWYAEEMTGYTNYLEDTIFCNDRSLYNPWSLTSSIENNNDLKLHFGAKARVAYTGKPTLECKYKSDSFTVDSTIGNGVLKYPVGLITFDEAALAGISWDISDDNSYLYNGKVWWTMSPGFLSATGVYIGVVHSMLDHVAVNYIGSSGNAGGVRPSISLKPDSIIQGGFGTPEKPFIIE